MAPHDDNDSDVEEPQTTLGSIEKSKTITFPIHAHYTNWNSREAFRELLQNWYVSHPAIAESRPVLPLVA
jgi:hypothetical protein